MTDAADDTVISKHESGVPIGIWANPATLLDMAQGCGGQDTPPPGEDAPGEDAPESEAEHYNFEGLRDWWLLDADQAASAATDKAKEYSSYDLLLIGRTQADMLGLDSSDDQRNTELGCLFYLLGKVARGIGAVKEGRRPSDDTWFDAYVYVQMIRRTRYAGSWPGPLETVEIPLPTATEPQ